MQCFVNCKHLQLLFRNNVNHENLKGKYFKWGRNFTLERADEVSFVEIYVSGLRPNESFGPKYGRQIIVFSKENAKHITKRI